MREKDREREKKKRDLPGWMTVATITKVTMTFALFMLLNLCRWQFNLE